MGRAGWEDVDGGGRKSAWCCNDRMFTILSSLFVAPSATSQRLVGSTGFSAAVWEAGPPLRRLREPPSSFHGPIWGRCCHTTSLARRRVRTTRALRSTSPELFGQEAAMQTPRRSLSGPGPPCSRRPSTPPPSLRDPHSPLAPSHRRREAPVVEAGGRKRGRSVRCGCGW